jgi:hypothetical protein
MNGKSTRYCLRHAEPIRGHLWYRYLVNVKQARYCQIEGHVLGKLIDWVSLNIKRAVFQLQSGLEQVHQHLNE